MRREMETAWWIRVGDFDGYNQASLNLVVLARTWSEWLQWW